MELAEGGVYFLFHGINTEGGAEYNSVIFFDVGIGSNAIKTYFGFVKLYIFCIWLACTR